MPGHLVYWTLANNWLIGTGIKYLYCIQPDHAESVHTICEAINPYAAGG